MRTRSRQGPICAPFLRVNGQSVRIGARDLLFHRNQTIKTQSTSSLRPTRSLMKTRTRFTAVGMTILLSARHVFFANFKDAEFMQ